MYLCPKWVDLFFSFSILRFQKLPKEWLDDIDKRDCVKCRLQLLQTKNIKDAHKILILDTSFPLGI